MAMRGFPGHTLGALRQEASHGVAQGATRPNDYAAALAGLLCGVLAIGAGCTPNDAATIPKGLTFAIEDRHQTYSNALEPVTINLLFSNSSQENIALATNGFRPDFTLIITTQDRVQRATNWTSMMNGMPYPAGYDTEILMLAPGDTYQREFRERWGYRFLGVSATSLEERIVAVFAGWGEWGRPGQPLPDISEFPLRVRPFVWQTCITSQPIVVRFREPIDTTWHEDTRSKTGNRE
jgi:hypothetical protein